MEELENFKKDIFMQNMENYDYISLTETICDAVQTYYDLTGLDYMSWSEMPDDVKTTYIGLTKWAIDEDVDYYDFHEEWKELMKGHRWKYLDDEEYNKYRRWDYRLKPFDELDYERKSFSKLYISLIHALKELFFEY